MLIESNPDMKWQPTLKDYILNYNWNDCCKWALVSEEEFFLVVGLQNVVRFN